VLSERPPRLELELNNVMVTRDASLRLRGRATDETRVRDIYVFSGISKVFYRSNAHATNARELAFEANVPLHDGMNYVNVIVRETDDVITRRTLVIRRDGPNGEILATPRVEDDLFGMEEEE
jgi:carboxyl-terminal processing protease